jgi:phosphoglycerate-specific signal transduction histidine kinase
MDINHLENQMSYAMADVVTLEVILEDIDDMGMDMKNVHRTLAMELVIKHLKEIIEEVQDRIAEDFRQSI